MNEIGSRRLGVHNVAKTIELSKVFSCELVRIGCLRVTGTTWKFQKMGTNTQSTGFEIQGKNTVLRGCRTENCGRGFVDNGEQNQYEDCTAKRTTEVENQNQKLGAGLALAAILGGAFYKWYTTPGKEVQSDHK